MESTDLNEDWKDLAEAPVIKDEENINVAVEDSSTPKVEEPTFDTGVLAWLQVVGSFFLFFNSWYECHINGGKKPRGTSSTNSLLRIGV